MTKKRAMEMKRQPYIRKLARLHGLLTVFVFGVYFSAGFFLHPSFLVSDIREKIRAVADTIVVMARVLDPPVKPVVTGTGVCASGGPTVVLDWANDENSTSYNITRDSVSLTTGVVTSGYTDTTIALGQTYEYVVTAIGPMGPGFNDADPISVTAPTECTPAVIPTITVQTFSGDNIVGATGRQFTIDRNPRFTGVTNLANARIDISATSDREVIATTIYANANGYFEWSYSGRFDFDSYDVVFTATDIGNSSLSATQKVKIGIEKESIKTTSSKTPLKEESFPPEQSIRMHSNLDFMLTVSGTEFHAGDMLTADIALGTISNDLIGSNATASFLIVDGDGKAIDRETEGVVLRNGLEMHRFFRIPYGMKNKDYRLVVEIRTQNVRSSREVAFRVLELPLFKIGGETVTYEQAVSQIGWVSFVSLFFFFWWLLLFLREYYLYSQSDRNIYGQDLHKSGYF